MPNLRLDVGNFRSQYVSFRRWLCGFALIAIAMLACTACGDSSAEAAANQILAQVQKFHVADVTLNLAITLIYQGKPSKSSGTMKFSQTPARFDAMLQLSISGTSQTVEEIGDIAGGVVYAKAISPASQAGTLWIKQSIKEFSFTYAEVFAFDNLSNARLIGAEVLGDIPVWHLKGDIIGGTATSTGDVYVRKDSYAPVKTIVTDSGSVSTKTTMVYTAFNTGISIALPPDNQIQNT